MTRVDSAFSIALLGKGDYNATLEKPMSERSRNIYLSCLVLLIVVCLCSSLLVGGLAVLMAFPSIGL